MEGSKNSVFATIGYQFKWLNQILKAQLKNRI